MKKPGVAFRIVVPSIIIMFAVIISGYFVHRSQQQILHTIHHAARPDQQLMLVKEIASDLSEIENNVRIFLLTGNRDNLLPYEQLNQKVQVQLDALMNASDSTRIEKALLDTVQQLVLTKLKIWEDILVLHFSKDDLKTSFSDIYDTFEKQTTDTIAGEKEQKGFFRRLFGRKDTLAQYSVVERSLEKDQIKREIRHIETNILEKSEMLELKETALIRQNLEVSGKLSDLIALVESAELSAMVDQTREADRLAALTNKRLLAFSITAVVLVLLIIFTFFDHLKKSRAYQRLLKKAKNEAEALTRAKAMFVANVSHELRNPVNAIYGLAEQAANTGNQQSELMEYLLKASAHLKHIVNQTLDFSKLQTDSFSIVERNFSPEALFREIMAIHAIEANQKGLYFNFESNGTFPPALLGDPVRLKQIVINLVGNALKFTREGGVTLQVACNTTDRECQLHVEVIDTGIGIAPEHLPEIFEEFSQVEHASTNYSGTGLGLAISKKLLEIQGGNIWVESTQGKGTTMGFDICYALGIGEGFEGESQVLAEVPEQFRELEVLVVDDEAYNRYLLGSILKKWGARVAEAGKGTEAIRAAMKHPLHLIFMDLRMSGMNGFDTARELLKIQPQTIILATSASSKSHEIEACTEAGMVAILHKPFTEKELYEKVLEALRIDPSKAEMMPVDAIPEVDLSELRRQANGDEKFFHEMLEIFLESSLAGMKAINEALRENKPDAMMEAAHKLAAPCKHLQASKLYVLLKQIENSAHKNSDISPLAPLIKQLDDMMHALRQYLQKQLEK